MALIVELITKMNKWYDSLDSFFRFLFTCCMVFIPFLIAFVGSGPVESIGLIMLLVLVIVRGYWVFIGSENEKNNSEVSKTDS